MKVSQILIGLVLLAGCSSDKNSFLGKYYGGWAETLWIVSLHEDNRFEYRIEGHIANQTVTGDFTQVDDTLILTPKNGLISDGFKEKKLLIVGDSCLIDLDVGYDYCKSRPDEWISRKWKLDTIEPEPYVDIEIKK